MRSESPARREEPPPSPRRLKNAWPKRLRVVVSCESVKGGQKKRTGRKKQRSSGRGRFQRGWKRHIWGTCEGGQLRSLRCFGRRIPDGDVQQDALKDEVDAREVKSSPDHRNDPANNHELVLVVSERRESYQWTEARALHPKSSSDTGMKMDPMRASSRRASGARSGFLSRRGAMWYLL